MTTQQVAHTPKVKVCAEVEHEFLKHGGMNFCPNCGANVKDKANSLARAAAPELLEALKAIQFGFNHRRCPACGGWGMSPQGETDMVHNAECIVGNAISKAEHGK